MQILTSDEFRLAYALLLSGLLFALAFRFVRRIGVHDTPQALLDAFLLFYVAQYLIVAVLGLLGLLAPWSIAVLALAASGAMWLAPWPFAGRTPPEAKAQLREPVQPTTNKAGRHGTTAGAFASAVRSDPAASAMPLADQLLLWGSLLFALGYSGCVAWILRHLPVMSNDAMAYHLPAAIQWLRTGRLALYEAWFYNPANVYSPLAGSTFMAWLIAPMGDELLVRYVQFPAVLFVFFAVVQLCRLLSLRPGTAALVAATAVLSRSFASQFALPKDDLFLAAFFAVAVIGLAPRAAGAEQPDAYGPWRAGLGLGMFLATKYTALFSLPLLLLLADAPFRSRWRWRQWAIALGGVLLLAGPWYLRNASLTGNPLYPTDVRLLGRTLFQGLFTMEPSHGLRSAAGVWQTLVGGYYSQPVILAVVLAAAWALALVRSGRLLLRDPLRRLCVLGPALGLLVFVFASPYAEIRFLYPSLLLLFGCLGIVLVVPEASATTAETGAPRILSTGAIAAGIACILICAATAFPPETAAMATTAGVLAPAATGVAILLRTWGVWFATPRQVWATAGAGLAVMALAVYVAWPSYVETCRGVTADVWAAEGYYGELGEAWRSAREALPADATVAYANTYLVYPLYGPQFTRTLVYAPTRPGLTRSTQLPHFPRPLPGEEIPGAVPKVMAVDADERTWLQNLKACGARYVFVGTRDLGKPEQAVVPPELAFIQANPRSFQRIDKPDDAGRLNSAAALYEITW